MVFCVSVEFGVPLVIEMPITDAVVVVPVPMLLVRLRTVFEVSTAGALLVNMPSTCEAAPVAFSCIEFATLPPTVLPVAFQVTVVPVNARMPISRTVPEAPRLVTEMPPTVLLFDVHAFDVKLWMP